MAGRTVEIADKATMPATRSRGETAEREGVIVRSGMEPPLLVGTPSRSRQDGATVSGLMIPRYGPSLEATT